MMALLTASMVLLHGKTVQAEAAPADQPAAIIEMTNSLDYEPAKVTIKAGETVRWDNVSQVVHTVTADADLAGDDSHVKLPKGVEPFDSGDIPAGGSYSHRFDVPGHYVYFCIPHERAGMVGELIVEMPEK